MSVPTPVFVFSPAYEADIGPHVFPTFKYRRVKERLLESRTVPPEAFAEPEPGNRRMLALAHEDAYLDDLMNLRQTRGTVYSELPLTGEIVRWFELACFGTVTTTRLAAARGAAMHLGGGFHHAFADHAEGFCYLNDTAVAARVALGDGTESRLTVPDGREVTRVSVVDLDVHQGNGTARIFRDDDRVFTFSMHQENNYPMKERSDLDMGLADRIDDDDYLARLDEGLRVSVTERRPELIYYLAGADPYRDDLLGGLALTLDGMAERDRRVLGAAREVGASVVALLAGGYAADPEDTVAIHLATARELLRLWPRGEGSAPATPAPGNA
jgi:acetoin utilization deacetylase AcuC-like enzyme